jgi:nucleotide-binding universal stress UspA family protein
MIPMRAILHPTDFSDRSQRAFELACRLARDSGARLIVLHVVQPPPFVTHGEMEKALQQAEGYRRDLNDQLHNLRPTDPKIEIEYLLEEGEPVAEIIRAVTKNNCDLIVLGTHGRTGFRRLLLGSVAEQVLRRATCPVLTVSTPVQETSLRASMKDRKLTIK